MEFIIKQRKVSKVRFWLLKKGLIKPKTLKETREVFNFPDATHERKVEPLNLWAVNHIERVTYL